MNPAQLPIHFDRISDAPDAIPRLRRFILDLAVRGKLVEQDPRDEPSTELLKRIQAEKERLVKAGKIRKQEPTRLIDEEEVSFEIPPGWCWVRLIDVLTKLTDGTHHSPTNLADGDFKYITAKNIKSGGVSLVDISYVTAKVHHEIYARCNPEKGDILYIKDGATTGIVTINDLDEPFSMLSSVALLKLSSHVYNRLMVEFLRSPFFYVQMRGFMKGAAITRVTLKRMAPALIPLPPLAEQHRIVAKVDELMALCDRLEATQAERESRRDRLATSSLNRLNKGADPDAFRDHARFYFNQFPSLTTRLEHIRQLRQTILNLAVRGKLVPQEPNDESASKMLGKHELFPDVKNKPWALPLGWAWSSLGLIGETLGGGTPSKADPKFWHGRIPWVSPKDMKVDVIKDAQDHISESAIANSSTRLIPSRSLLMVVRGMILAHSFPTAISAVPLTINQDMKAIVPFRPDLIPMLLLLTKGLKPEVLRLVLRSTHGTCKLLTADLFSLPLPIPPIAEQHRIVAKVEELMAICDRLEAQLTTTQTESRRLLEAVLHRTLRQAPSTDVPEATNSSQKLARVHTTTATTGRPNKHFARTLLSAEIVHQLHAEPTFGRIKHQKILHLCEHIAQIQEVSGEYYRQVAGPLDNRLIYTVETALKKQRWYEEYRRPQYGHGYKPLEKAGGHQKYLERYWPDKLPVIRRLVDIMRTWDTDRCEMFATAYAAWNDLLIWKREPTDKAILNEILGRWHERKKRFSEMQWRAVIAWIRKEGFIPVGFGRPTKQLANP